ncbi:arsenite efflux MFS transporter ArsK [Rhizobium sp. C4]|uniref:arsenite efflux MFS transporter ArsK n=1 Tax=Rhizobium sp. C4 TaxID=1349800 RepID=UPI001E51EAB1|nr:arsenite efflux MFS transporter ArsK [Rhizobium sp. C4]MCD2175845.1 arsenite efflux MFS transporter ArsK [Rhizobium sp. C4]
MSRPHARHSLAIVAALGLTQIVGYGTLYYSFSILAPGMAQDVGLSRESVFGTFSAALLGGGLAAPFMGGWMDRFGAARMMVLGSALCAGLLLACAWSPAVWFFIAAVIAIQVASGLVTYQAAFASLVEHAPQNATRNITYLTLIAGFASSVFWPITTTLAAHFTWREIYLIFAGLNLVLCLPVHLLLARRGSGQAEPVSGAATHPPVLGVLAPQERRRAMIVVSIAFALSGFSLSSILIHMVPMLGALGLGVAAVTVSALFGPAQVASRLVNMIFGERLPPTGLAMLSSALIALGGILLAITDGNLVGAVVFALCVGLGSGIGSIAQGSVPLHLFGSQGYGAIAGRMTAARLVASAAAPAVFALGMERLGIPVSLFLNAALGLLGMACFALVGRARRPLE